MSRKNNGDGEFSEKDGLTNQCGKTYVAHFYHFPFLATDLTYVIRS
jgi:hypothetical protein